MAVFEPIIVVGIFKSSLKKSKSHDFNCHFFRNCLTINLNKAVFLSFMTLNDYACLSRFDIPPDKGRDIVRLLIYDSGIKHFLFFDAMERAEMPIDPSKKEWRNPLGGRIRRDTIDAYLDEIRKINGKSWFSSGTNAVSKNYQFPQYKNALFSYLLDKTEGKHKFQQEWFCVDENPDWPFVSLIDPRCDEWKEKFTHYQTLVIREVGFTGVHFDSGGVMEGRFDYAYLPEKWDWNNVYNPECFEKVKREELMADYIKHFKEACPEAGVTLNIVDGWGMDEVINLVDFPHLQIDFDYHLDLVLEKLQ